MLLETAIKELTDSGLKQYISEYTGLFHISLKEYKTFLLRIGPLYVEVVLKTSDRDESSVVEISLRVDISLGRELEDLNPEPQSANVAVCREWWHDDFDIGMGTVKRIISRINTDSKLLNSFLESIKALNGMSQMV